LRQLQDGARLKRQLKTARMQQAASAEILRAVANPSGDAARPLQQIAETTARVFGAPSVSIQLTQGGEFTQEYRVGAIAQRIGSAYPRSNIRVGGRNLPGTVVFENRQIHIPDLDHLDPSMSDFPGLPHARAGGARTVCGTPLRREGKAFGALIIFRDRLLPFTEDELTLQQSFADQAVIAIENARLFNETREALERQTATADILKVIASSPSDAQPVFEAIAVNSKRLVGGFSTAVFRIVDDVAYLVAFTPTTPHADEAMKSWFPQPLANFRFTGTEVVQIADTDSDPMFEVREIARLRGFRSLFYTPLISGGKSIGVISVTRQEPGKFAERHVELLKTFADQAVIAIENVRLFHEVQARTRELAASLDNLRAAQDRLVQTEKLASLGQLTAGIAHEIKNPLNFVNNFAALSAELIVELNEVLKPAGLDGKIREEVDELTRLLKGNLEKVVQHGKRADSIVKNMLLHSREGSGEHRSAEINALIEESLNLAYHGARAENPGFNIGLKRDLDPDAGAVELYPQEITRALLNLISNGFYAATQRKLAGEETFEPVLIAATKNRGKTVEIRIRDNGTGIPDEVKEKIFNPFFTTKPPGEGTGLGLSMSHDIIVKQHGGSIEVATEPGVFTEFKIILPRATQA
jgi:signal transduction histidine kinase